MTDKKSIDSKRKLLKSIAAGSGAIMAGKSLPESWSRPVVNAIVLPSHAQTSPPLTTPALTTPALTYSCSVAGPAAIFDGPAGVPLGPFEYTITNTGTGPLTGGDINVPKTDGTTGGINFMVDLSGGIPDPLAPGSNFTISLTGVSVENCSIPTGAGQLTVVFTSNETACQQIVDVTCAVLT